MTIRTVSFRFEGRTLRGIEGEPIAKALFTAGIRTLSYSVKYKRPRGIHCARGRCVMCHMSVNGVPGVPTCVTPLAEGMIVEREDYRPFYAPLLTAAARLIPFPAGFYYRMFNRPRALRHFFLAMLRRMAGTGRLLTRKDDIKTYSPTHHRVTPPVRDWYHVVVVGSGVSGMSAAVAAATAGAEVLLIDEYHFLGGHSIGFQPDGDLAAARDQLIERIDGSSAIHCCLGTTAQGFFRPDTVLLGPGGSTRFGPHSGTGADSADRGKRVSTHGAMHRIHGSVFIFATGANDLVPLFENSDTPGIFGSRATRLLFERDDFTPGHRAVVYGTGTALRDAACLLLRRGVAVTALVDPSPTNDEDGREPAVLDRIRRVENAAVVTARGGEWIQSVDVSCKAGREMISIPCDLLCVAFPGQPAYELPYQAGFEYSLSDSTLDEHRVMLPVTTRIGPDANGPVTFALIGEAAGQVDWRRRIEDGRKAGAHAAVSARGHRY